MKWWKDAVPLKMGRPLQHPRVQKHETQEMAEGSVGAQKSINPIFCIENKENVHYNQCIT